MQNSFKKIGVIYNPDITNAFDVAHKMSNKINNSEIFSIDNFQKDIDLAFVIGGDGTFLKASRFYSKYDIPIMGFNMGRLGYLAQANPSEIDEVVSKLNTNDYTIENRLMLEAEGKIALNDIVIKGTNSARTSTLDLYINNKKLCSYVADGLIIATPTGSTAYSLSAGGPIISPNVDCFLIIPICPHTLNTRPVVIPSNEEIKILASEKKQDLVVSCDGQVELTTDNEIHIKKYEKNAKLLILNKQKDKFYDILKEKLHWSIAPKR